MTIEELIGQTYELRGHGRWLRSIEHDSLVVDTERQAFFWNSKSVSGNAYKWLTEVLGYTHEDATAQLKNSDTFIFSKAPVSTEKYDVVPYPKLVDVFYSHGKDHREYWYDIRGYTEETVDRFRLGFNDEWYTIPVYVDGEFKNFQCLKHNPRRRKSWYAGLGALPFNFSNLAVTDWVVLTEGPVDAIMLRQNNIPAVSQTGGSGTWKNKWLPYFIKTKTIYIAYDNDIAGNEGSLKPAKNLGSERSLIYNFWDFNDGYDITDFFKDGGTKDEFLELLNSKAVQLWSVPRRKVDG